MSKETVLARVDADLSRGHTYVALQRLATLTQTYPTDLEIRGRRAAVHRQVGNRVEAGRWGYLADDPDPAETAAFERAFPDPRARLSALRWRGRPDDAGSAAARDRLLDLAARVEEHHNRRIEWTETGPEEEKTWRDIVSCLVAILVGLGMVALVVIGAATVIGWVFS